MKNNDGSFGEFGGRFVPQIIERDLKELEQAFEIYRNNDEFRANLRMYLREYVGRPSPLTAAANLTETCKGAKIYLKREDLNHTGAHKINNTLGQVLLARAIGKKRIVAETGAGQHGVATATACALFDDVNCIIYQGEEDMRRQNPNVHRMKMLGAEVQPVTTGNKTLKEAVDAAFEDYAANTDNSFYMLGSAVGPHPYPLMVREFQSVIGKEARQQILEKSGQLPSQLVACVGGGSNAIGLFHPFIDDENVKMLGVEPGGSGTERGEHAASITHGKPGILHGFKCYTLSKENGDPAPVHSIAAGLDYPGVGPEHCYLKEKGRADYTTVNDEQALEGFKTLCQTEGIIPALESAHAVYAAMQLASNMSLDETIIVNISGRGDKDIEEIAHILQK